MTMHFTCADRRAATLARLRIEEEAAEPFLDRMLRPGDVPDRELLEILENPCAGYAQELAWAELERRSLVDF
jgi:hypothetical protein